MEYSEGKLPPSYDVAENELPYQIKLALWQTAFGLQKVDGLSPSEYMVELAYENIEGKKGYDAIYREISDYHLKEHVDANTVEADIVSLRIAELLAEDHFLLSPSTLLGIHRHLFTDVFPEEIPVGKFRTVNITKNEPVLNGETVAVFGIQYLRKLGLHIDYSLFSEHVAFFRNALVLYYYQGEKQDKQYLKMFFENLLLGKQNVLSDEALRMKE
ncbi:hypothetical protein [Trichococcus pasteurii]|uniref:protein adenylyltransferase n=1 Tax=Trichococcus pasteurii TaxID=43064 RepID=A0A1W1IIL0_9LACT|nr:hypothetical protein [Trichococcus pasteurii]SFE76556.1 hypothetical protein SAMN04488086_11017 [Trichococcus pasteurii]SLM52914.1 Hypothetical protein TPAS_2622 [Trichococcus pasteurii]SSB93795.1 Hypothetical protein TPAS_2622 [Trichococcus pasteurii]